MLIVVLADGGQPPVSLKLKIQMTAGSCNTYGDGEECSIEIDSQFGVCVCAAASNGREIDGNVWA